MVRTLWGSLVLIFGWVVISPVHADDATAAQAIIDKAIKAQGGDKLGKSRGITIKSKGKFFGLGQPVDFTGETSTQLPSQLRVEFAMEFNGMTFKFMQVVNGDKGWVRLNDETKDMDKDALAEAKEQLYASWVTSLLPLREKGFTLSPLGDSKIGDQDAVGVRVSHKDRRDVSLYFDKKSGLLLKSETRGKDVQGGGNEFSSESFFKDYKDFDGVKRATKLIIKRDGKDFVESEVTDYKTEKKLDDSVFAKP
jgi:hypothetical protein